MSAEPSLAAMVFALKWLQSLGLDDFGTTILAKAPDELLNTRKPDVNADLLAALILAANRLQRIAVELIADGNSAHFEVSEWVEESRAAITKAQTGEAI